MLIDQGDLLWEMDFLFVKNFMAVSAKVDFAAGRVIFREGDKADYFFTLVEGRVRLSVGEAGREIYIIDKAGEAFGWSSLVDRETYTARAECLEPSTVYKIEKGWEDMHRGADLRVPQIFRFIIKYVTPLYLIVTTVTPSPPSLRSPGRVSAT